MWTSLESLIVRRIIVSILVCLLSINLLGGHCETRKTTESPETPRKEQKRDLVRIDGDSKNRTHEKK